MKFVILLLIPLLAFATMELTFPKTSQEFAHWSMPILTGEGTIQTVNIIQDWLLPDLRPDTRYINSWMIGMAISYISYNFLFNKHYETDREKGLAVNELGILFTAHLIEFAIRMPIWHREQNKKIATMEKWKTETLEFK